jgi:hypothetical protein
MEEVERSPRETTKQYFKTIIDEDAFAQNLKVLDL